MLAVRGGWVAPRVGALLMRPGFRAIAASDGRIPMAHAENDAFRQIDQALGK